MSTPHIFVKWLYGLQLKKRNDRKEKVLKIIRENNYSTEKQIFEKCGGATNKVIIYLEELLKEGKIEGIQYGAKGRFYRAKF